MKKTIQQFAGMMIVSSMFLACKKDKDPVIVVKPSTGAQVQFNGLIGSEPGSAAGNSVYLDLSADKVTAVARASWDLGFYSGSEFRVILNNTTSSAAKVLSKTDLSTVGEADTIGLTLAINQVAPAPSDLAWFDAASGSINNTVIPAVSATDAANPVIIVNRGTGGSISPRAWVKMRVLRNPSGGYTLQYAGIRETSFRTLTIAKNSDFHFTFVSFDNGIVNVQPEKSSWDLTWSYSVFQTEFPGIGTVAYNFSDLIAINHLSNVQVAEKKYASNSIAAAAYTAFNRDSVSNSTFVSDRWAIGSSWRSTQPATGALQDRFYIIKDPNGHYYKLRCLSMGVGSDGGTRGKPEFKYELIP